MIAVRSGFLTAGSVGAEVSTRLSSDTPSSTCVRDPRHVRRVTEKVVLGSAASALRE
jgi:hypothetical protein